MGSVDLLHDAGLVEELDPLAEGGVVRHRFDCHVNVTLGKNYEINIKDSLLYIPNFVHISASSKQVARNVTPSL